MRKYKLQWYRWRRKRLRAAMKKMNNAGTRLTPKSSARYTKLQNKYNNLGMKWWDTPQPVMFEGAPLGKDITHEDYSMNDVREAMSGQNPFQSQPGTWEYRSIRVGEDKSTHYETHWELNEHGVMVQRLTEVPRNNG